MAVNITELRQKRAQIVEEMRKLQDSLLEKGSETAEERDKFDKMEHDIRALEVIIDREETLQKAEADLAKSQDDKRDKTHDRRSFDDIRYPLGRQALSRGELERRVSYAVQGWLRAGKQGYELSQEHVDAARFFSIDLRAKEIDLPIVKDYRQLQAEFRDLNVATGGAGKETIPQGFVYNLEQALLAFGGVRSVATVMRTDSGNALPWPTMNDTSNKGAILAEATTIGTSVDPTFATLTLNAFKYSSKPILCSYELLQDSAFDLGAMIGGWLGTRIARIQNDHFTTGAGTTLPRGLTVAGTVGKTAVSMTAFTADEVIDLQHSLDPAYRVNATWMFHDSILAVIRKMKDTTNQYLWQPSYQAGVPDRLLGATYTVNQSMASALTTGQKLILWGQMSKYIIRDVATIRLMRLEERYADLDQVAFIAFLRTDANLLDAGTHPVVYLKLA